jgi:hypothetical protein
MNAGSASIDRIENKGKKTSYHFASRLNSIQEELLLLKEVNEKQYKKITALETEIQMQKMQFIYRLDHIEDVRLKALEDWAQFCKQFK